MKKRVTVPDWAKDAIWYQIFPERFRNGRPRSNPRVEDIGDSRVPGWRITPWGMDWYAQAPWERKRGDFFKSVYLRRYGGDLIGVRQKLGYLQDLGINAIYLNPVFQARSLHKYDGACFHHIDPTFGPDRDGDLKVIARAGETENPDSWAWTSADEYFAELVADAHARKMRIIIDGVFNHTGRDFFAFRDLLINGKRSRYRDWYKIKKWNEDGAFEYEGWFGHQMLPEFAQVRDNLAPPVREYIFNITRRWMTRARIDGWRLDVAFCIPHGFWRDWRKLVKQLNPEAYTTAEIVSLATEYLRGDEFDAVMNYMWLFAAASFFTPNRAAVSANEFRRRLNEIRRAYPEETGYALQNLLDSHDVGRILTVFENRFPPVEKFSDFFEATRVKNRPGLRTQKPGPAAVRALKQMVAFQCAYVGAPMIYYGTEVGLWGANDPCDRQPMLWDDISYEDERRGWNREVAVSHRAPDMETFRFFQRAFQLRKSEAALRRGELRWKTSGHPRVAIFERKLKRDVISCVFNPTSKPAHVSLHRGGVDLWTGQAVAAGSVKIERNSWLILKHYAKAV